MDLLSRLLLPAIRDNEPPSESRERMRRDALSLSREGFEDLVALANTNHVIVRGLEEFQRLAVDAKDDMHADWAATALARERARIANALPYLASVCNAFEEARYKVSVIKSLDHLPDLGSDLDLFTDAGADDVIMLMKTRFGAQIAPRSWGDRLAGKWNFLLPGLPEAVEVHVGMLGQTGEQASIAASLLGRTRVVTAGVFEFRVPSASDRLILSVLQRMYRHFYFRLCDVVDSAELADSGAINYAELRSEAETANIWEGVATYLAIISDYVRRYRGSGIDLPRMVLTAVRFGGDAIYFARGFLRIPILPQSASLYGSQLAGILRRRELMNGARLFLLPCLATAALIGEKITGSDKGIW